LQFPHGQETACLICALFKTHQEKLRDEKNRSAEEFISKHPQWRELLETLREILRSTELEETIKWGVPVYTLDGRNHPDDSGRQGIE
jgi:hypothetical protein